MTKKNKKKTAVEKLFEIIGTFQLIVILTQEYQGLKKTL